MDENNVMAKIVIFFIKYFIVYGCEFCQKTDTLSHLMLSSFIPSVKKENYRLNCILCAWLCTYFHRQIGVESCSELCADLQRLRYSGLTKYTESRDRTSIYNG